MRLGFWWFLVGGVVDGGSWLQVVLMVVLGCR